MAVKTEITKKIYLLLVGIFFIITSTGILYEKNLFNESVIKPFEFKSEKIDHNRKIKHGVNRNQKIPIPRYNYGPEFNYINVTKKLHRSEIKTKLAFDMLPKEIRKSGFCNILLIVIYNWPHYDATPVLREMFEYVFPNMVTCGSKSNNEYQPDVIVQVNGGYKVYHCAAVVMEKYKQYEGYYVSSDDVILNWWQIHNFPKDQIWTSQAIYPHIHDAPYKINWVHWNVPRCQLFNEKLFDLSKTNKTMRKLYENYMETCGGYPCCAMAWSDTFYVPKKYAESFIVLSSIAYKMDLFLETAVPLILGSCVNAREHIILKGLNNQGGEWIVPQNLEFWLIYNASKHFHHPFKIGKDKKNGCKNIDILRKHYISYTKKITAGRYCEDFTNELHRAEDFDVTFRHCLLSAIIVCGAVILILVIKLIL